MNTIRFELENVVGRQLIRGGIVFEDIAIVRVFIDEEDLLESVDFDGALVCFDELKRSMAGSGNYLLFTCACGIAEDGGWEGVAVEMTETTVSWHLEAGSRALNYCFDLTGYVASLEALGRTLATNALPLEPEQVVFPDSFIPRKDLWFASRYVQQAELLRGQEKMGMGEEAMKENIRYSDKSILSE